MKIKQRLRVHERLRDEDARVLSGEQRTREFHASRGKSRPMTGRDYLFKNYVPFTYPAGGLKADQVKHTCAYILKRYLSGAYCTAIAHDALTRIRPTWRELRGLLVQLLGCPRPKRYQDTRDPYTFDRMRVLAIKLLVRMRATDAIGVMHNLSKSCYPEIRHAAMQAARQLKEKA